jgi:hypothetical protein
MATAIQFLRSAIPSLRPNPVTIEDGMPMLNTNEVGPGLFFRLRNDTLCKIGPIHVGSTAPNSAPQGHEGNTVGEAWLDTSGVGSVFKVWDGSSWQAGESTNSFPTGLEAQRVVLDNLSGFPPGEVGAMACVNGRLQFHDGNSWRTVVLS